ncbi:MAG: anti-sigma regulatory factor [Deltaproteobacteria bacterium]|nr:MAG: anti-sigma regulatory factor [Deltaproteobacteria bacterium]
MAGETSIPVRSDADVVFARQKGRELAAALGFGPTDLTLVATAISELTRNIVLYAKRGRIVLKSIERDGTLGIMVVARDDGPGIPNVARALESGFSTSGGLGLGLPGVKRLTDEFDIVSEVGRGTTVTVKKWTR